MKIKEKNGVTLYCYYEIDKAFRQYERGVPFCEYFKHKAQKFKYGENAYFKMVKKEVEEYEQRDWNHLIELKQIDSYFVCEILKGVDKIKKTLDSFPPEPITKQKSELPGKLIIFKNSETIEKVHSELKGFFSDNETELLKALKGEKLTGTLLFPHNQNKLVEVFRRLKYNGFLLNNDTEVKNWICSTFQFKKKGYSEPQPFNGSTVWDNLNKGKGEPTKKQRICITDWLPYKRPSQLDREAENEKL